MPEPREVRSLDIVGAIRLALVGAADDAAAVKVITQLCDYAPSTPDAATGPTELLIDAVRDVKGKYALAAVSLSAGKTDGQ